MQYLRICEQQNVLEEKVSNHIEHQWSLGYNHLLSDSIVNGCYLKDTIVVSCHGADLNALASQNVFNYSKSKHVKKAGIMGGTNDLELDGLGKNKK